MVTMENETVWFVVIAVIKLTVHHLWDVSHSRLVSFQTCHITYFLQ